MGRTELQVPAAAQAAADRWLDAQSLRFGEAVFLWPGTSAAQAHKRWPLDHWRTLARGLTRQGLPVVLGWGPAEREWMKDWIEAPGSGEHVPPLLGLMDLAGLLSRCRGFCGGDTGPMHLAALLGAPSLVLYGPTSPLVNRSWLAETRAIGESAGEWLDIPSGALHREPLATLDPAEVLASLLGVLSASQAGKSHAD